jgi:hypothetical protein
MPRESTSTNCPLCVFSPGRDRFDALVRHISRKHTDPTVFPLVTEAGHAFEPVSPGSHIVFCPAQKVGCCLKCSHPLHVSGVCKDRRAFFAGHVCKEKQVRDYGLGAGKGRKATSAPSTPTAASPVVQKVVETKTVRIIEKVITVPEEMERTLREHQKLSHLFKKPEPTPKENEDDWTDSEEEYEESFGEILMRHLLSIPKLEAALKRATSAAAVAELAAEQRDDAKDMAIRDLQKENAALRESLHFTALDKSAETQKAHDLMKIVETHAPTEVVKAVRCNGYQLIASLPGHG